MKILIEGIRYDIESLTKIFDDPKFYTQNGSHGTIIHVGYYHSFSKNQLVYLLPKVFVNDGLVFGKYTPIDLLNEDISTSFKHEPEFLWVRQLLVYFYKSLSEFKKRFSNSSIAQSSQTFEVNTNIGASEYSYLDLLLSFINFYKKNKTTILYHHIEHVSNQSKKPKWEKTINKSLPVLDSVNAPVYTEIRNKKKIKNSEEELLTTFFSIINHFNLEHSLGLKIDESYNLIEGSKFATHQKFGLSKLRKIKFRYFSDTLKRMYQLCELYLSQTNTTNPKRRKEEFITVMNYNIVFEDMVDKLFSDELDLGKTTNNYSLNDLKYNNDGKIIDHIYEDKSLIDTSNIFYIGDSKYYKPGSEAGKLSTFKQFTYSKNVIQFNIDLFNETKRYYNDYIRYRDEITEGYNITPNFFIYGFINNFDDFFDHGLENTNTPKESFHFEKRLFDRDTLFVQQYKINFLYVLRNYTSNNLSEITNFRKTTKESFRKQFIDFFNDTNKSKFTFYEKQFEINKLPDFIEENFKQLNGKCFSTPKSNLIIAKHVDDDTIDKILLDFHIKILY
jgi:hypothetical protein